MTFWFVAGGAIVGLLLGAFGTSGGLLGILFGAAAGWLWDRQQRLAARLAVLEARPAAGAPVAPPFAPPSPAVRPSPPVPPAGPATEPPHPVAAGPVPPSGGPVVPPGGPVLPPGGPGPAPGGPVPPSGGPALPPAGPVPPSGRPLPRPAGYVPPGASKPFPPAYAGARAPASDGPVPPAPDPFQPLRRLLGEGNVPVKVGVVVLFLGVGALLKYAADAGWLRMPVELRLAGISAAAIAALAFGFGQRIERRTFGLAVQGGAIGILAMTVFAAFRLHALLPASAAFALLVVLTAGAGLLAVLQDSRALAVLGILAGFLAPILVSTGSRNHVALFSWYALLDAAILAIAWFKAWRGLNVLGFAGTFAIGTAWGVLSYDPAKFASTEPFLALFFLFFVAIPVLHARRSGERGFVEGTLVFGTPLVTVGLQAALLQGERLPLAYAALAMAAVYLALATALLRREGYRVLGEAHALLAVAFATLAVPLALSAGTTAGVFALEGAALAWLGLRQHRLLPKLAGLGLEGLAGIAYLVALIDGDRGDLPVLNGGFAGAALLVIGALASAWLYHRKAGDGWRVLAPLLYLVGAFWWTAGGLRELDRFVASPVRPDGWIAFAAITGLLAAAIARRFAAAVPAWTAAAALALVPLLALLQLDAHRQPFTPWGLAAWAAFAAAGAGALALLRGAPRPAALLAHLAWPWSWTVVLGLSLLDVANRFALGASWQGGSLFAPLALLHGLLLVRPRAPFLGPRSGEARPFVLGTQACALAVGFVVALFASGDAAPLTYLPIANPQDLLGVAWGVLAAAWLADADAPAVLAKHRLPILAAGGFLLLTAATLRGVHHLADLPWNDALVASAEAQTGLAVVWSVLGVAGWVLGSRRANRQVWLAGAVLMGVVLLKLLAVDRQHLGNLAGIVSFLAYGLLCTVVGYLAPAPPRASPPAPEPHP